MLNDKQYVKTLIDKRKYADLNNYLLGSQEKALSEKDKFDLLRFALKDKKALKILLKNNFEQFTYPDKNVQLDSVFKEAIKNKHWKVAIYLIENYPEEFIKACKLDGVCSAGYRRTNTALMLIQCDFKSSIQKRLLSLCLKREDIHNKDSLGLPLIHSFLYAELHAKQDKKVYDNMLNKINYVLARTNYDIHIKSHSGDCMIGFANYKMNLSEELSEKHYFSVNLKTLFIEDERNKIREMMNKERISMHMESLSKNTNKVRI